MIWDIYRFPKTFLDVLYLMCLSMRFFVIWGSRSSLDQKVMTFTYSLKLTAKYSKVQKKMSKYFDSAYRNGADVHCVVQRAGLIGTQGRKDKRFCRENSWITLHGLCVQTDKTCLGSVWVLNYVYQSKSSYTNPYIWTLYISLKLSCDLLKVLHRSKLTWLYCVT